MKKTLFFAIVAIFALASCNEEIKEMKVLIEGSVTDSKTGAVVEGAEVSLTNKSNTDTVTTDENGYFELGQYNPGSYTLIVSKDGYLNSAVDVSSSSMFSTMNTVSPNEYVSVNLSPRTETLNLTVFKRYTGNAIKTVASNVPYTIYFSGYNDPVEGTTNENGLIEQSEMPATGNYTLEFDFEVGDYRYKATRWITANDESVTIYGYNDQGDFGLVSSNLLDDRGNPVREFDVDDDIELVFNQPVDTTDGYTVNGLNMGWGMEMEYNVEFENDDMKVVIDPKENLEYDWNYNFYFLFNNATVTDSYGTQINFITEEE